MLTASIIIAMIMEAVSTPETSVNFYQITRSNIPQELTSILAAVRT
jgi:hypothetical protein